MLPLLVHRQDRRHKEVVNRDHRSRKNSKYDDPSLSLLLLILRVYNDLLLLSLDTTILLDIPRFNLNDWRTRLVCVYIYIDDELFTITDFCVGIMYQWIYH